MVGKRTKTRHPIHAMEFIFNEKKLDIRYRYVINDERYTRGNDTKSTKELASTFAKRLSAIRNIKPACVSVSIENDTSNDEDRYMDCFYRHYFVKSVGELQSLATSVVSQVVGRCEKLLKEDWELFSTSLIRFHRYTDDKAPQSGRIDFRVEVSEPYKMNEWGHKSRRVFRSYHITLEVNEMDENQNIFG